MTPIVLEPIIQKADDDCGIACLAMLLGLPYATVSAAAPKRKHGGLTTRQILLLAKKLGTPLRLVKDFGRDDVGLLDLWRTDASKYGEAGHVAVYIHGTVWTTAAGSWWRDLDAYLKHHDWTLLGLLRPAGEL